MGTREIDYIKMIQRQFKSRFNKDLIIDLAAMENAVPLTAEQEETLMHQVCSDIAAKHGTTLENIRTIYNSGKKMSSAFVENKAVREIAQYVFKHKLNANAVASYLKMKRTNIYQYGRKYERKRSRVLHGNMDEAKTRMLLLQ